MRSAVTPNQFGGLGESDLAVLVGTGMEAGLSAVGWCRASAWGATRSRIEQARAEGRAATMAFTYRNPPRSTDPTRLLRNASTLIVGALAYGVEDRSTPPVGTAVVANYAAEDHYGALREALEVIAGQLRSWGHRARVIADDNGLVDREAAWRAGLGWYGKNSLLLNRELGSWWVIGSVVTEARLSGNPELAPRPIADGCGVCDRCIPACPTGAISAPGAVDARRCLSWLLQAPGSFPIEFRAALGGRIYGCDDCQTVCPPNRRVQRRALRSNEEHSHPLGDDADRGGLAGTDPTGASGEFAGWIDAAKLLASEESVLKAVVETWYVPGRDLNVVRRNLLLVLGNTADPADVAVRSLIVRFANGVDPLLAEHAAWALQRLTARAQVARTGPPREDCTP
jgi:epoxyqueuosine reductase